MKSFNFCRVSSKTLRMNVHVITWMKIYTALHEGQLFGKAFHTECLRWEQTLLPCKAADFPVVSSTHCSTPAEVLVHKGHFKH